MIRSPLSVSFSLSLSSSISMKYLYTNISISERLNFSSSRKLEVGVENVENEM